MKITALLFLCLAILIITDAVPVKLKRKKRTLGLIVAVASAVKIPTAVITAKYVGLSLLGKLALWRWIKNGYNAGTTAGVGVGPVQLDASVGGFSTNNDDKEVSPEEIAVIEEIKYDIEHSPEKAAVIEEIENIDNSVENVEYGPWYTVPTGHEETIVHAPIHPSIVHAPITIVHG